MLSTKNCINDVVLPWRHVTFTSVFFSTMTRPCSLLRSRFSVYLSQPFQCGSHLSGIQHPITIFPDRIHKNKYRQHRNRRLFLLFRDQVARHCLLFHLPNRPMPHLYIHSKGFRLWRGFHRQQYIVFVRIHLDIYGLVPKTG